ncbi:MAG: hypothetical protein R6V32_01570 [Bacteroidales bacterium]
MIFCFQPAMAAKWEKATIIPKEGDTFTGKIKARKRQFSTCIKYRDENNSKMTLKPEYIDRIITDSEEYKAIYFNKEVSGYNMWCFGKTITKGCINIYDVYYPYKSCACKTAGTYRHNWVLKAPEKQLFIIEHHFLSNKIKNKNNLLNYIEHIKTLKDTLFTFEGTRSDLKKIMDHYNQNCEEMNRTYPE